MSVDDFSDYRDEEEGPEPRPRDAKIDEAKEAIMRKLFMAEPDEVFYQRQIEIILEEDFFHWITTKALKELATEQRVKTELVPMRAGHHVRFYWSFRNRYYTRKRNEIQKLIQEHSDDNQATGNHGEMMFDAALPRVGFLPVGANVRQYKRRSWTETGHDLDRIFERDGIAYGTEIKNTMAYITQREMRIKLDMCDHLRLRPLFVMRFAPKSYIEEIRNRKGFALIFKYQLLPHGSHDIAKRLRERLRLPVDCPARINDGTIQRFLNWHLHTLHKPSRPQR